MKINVDWTFFLDVGTKGKCDKLIDKIRKSLDLELAVAKIEHYWKDKTLFKVNARSVFDAPTARDGLYLVMMTIDRLAHAWLVSVPKEEDHWEFGGTANRGSIRLQGIDSISFNASNVMAEEQNAMILQA